MKTFPWHPQLVLRRTAQSLCPTTHNMSQRSHSYAPVVTQRACAPNQALGQQAHGVVCDPHVAGANGQAMLHCIRAAALFQQLVRLTEVDNGHHTTNIPHSRQDPRLQPYHHTKPPPRRHHHQTTTTTTTNTKHVKSQARTDAPRRLAKPSMRQQTTAASQLLWPHPMG